MTSSCKHPGCNNALYLANEYCAYHSNPVNGPIRSELLGVPITARIDNERHRASDRSLAQLYPKYYKAIPKGWGTIDVYGVHYIFNVTDPSGALQHASKKILLSGARTGGKSQHKDIKEARDTLNRWLQMNPEVPAASTKELALAPQ